MEPPFLLPSACERPSVDVLDADGAFVVKFDAAGAVPLDILRMMLSTAFPAAAALDVKFFIHETAEPYPACPTQLVTNVSIDKNLRDLGSPARIDRRMSRYRQHSSPSSPRTLPRRISSPLSEGSPRLVDLRAGLDKALKTALCQRDQCCVVTCEFDMTLVQAAHVLNTEYAEDFFAQPGNSRYLARQPVLDGRRMANMDVRNSVLMSMELHHRFDSFHFSLVPYGDEIVQFWFRRPPLYGKHLEPISRPRLVPRAENPAYFVNRFPHPDVFREHFKQAVLRNMEAAGEKDDDSLGPDVEEIAMLSGLPPSASDETIFVEGLPDKEPLAAPVSVADLLWPPVV